MLNQRLLTCAEYVQGNFICDVGTDHAFLPIYLIQNQKIEKALAGDVRKGPLQSAERNIMKAGLSDKIQTVLSDGLQNVPPENLTDIVIAGMGGETILHILKTCPFSLENFNLVLQPMTKAELLRLWLYQNGFVIQQEKCVPDKKFLYTVMQVKYANIRRLPEISEMYFGKMDLKNPEGHAYAEHVVAQLKKMNYYENHELSSVIRRLGELL